MLMDSEFDEMFDQINYGIAAFIDEKYNPEDSVKDRFYSWWIAFATYANNKPFDFTYMDQLATSHLYPKIGLQASTAFYSESRKIVETGQNEGVIKDENISNIIQFIRCAISSVIKTHISTGKSMSDTHIFWIVETCWNGIKKEITALNF